MSLSENLRAARAVAGLSQQQVAGVVGIQCTSLSDVEHGSRAVSALELKAFAELFETSTDALLGHEIPLPGRGTPEGLVARLEKVTENLYGYLADRARELAEPHIQVAEQAVAERIRKAEFELQRVNDLLKETQLMWKADLKRAHRAEHRLGMMHPAGECGTCDDNRLAAKKGGS